MRALALALLLFLAACGGGPERTVTMDGRDTGGVIVERINLWDDLRTRARVTGRASHGERVTLVQQSGAGCEVRTADGAQGWVTCAHFIREYKP